MMSYSKFCRDYKKYAGRNGFASHIYHKAGDRLEVDCSSPTMRYTAPMTGRPVTVYLFVADLVSSRLAFVEPTLSIMSRTGFSAMSTCLSSMEVSPGSSCATTSSQESNTTRMKARLSLPQSMSSLQSTTTLQSSRQG